MHFETKYLRLFRAVQWGDDIDGWRFFTHRIATHLDAECVVNQPVTKAVGGCRIADLLVPARYRQLRSENQRSALITVFANLPEVTSLWF